IGERVAGIGDLIEADNSAVFAFAVAATAKVDAQGYVTPLGKLFGNYGLAMPVLVAAEAMQDNKRRPAFAGLVVGRSVDETCDLESVRLKGDFFFHSFTLLLFIY